MGIFSQKDEYGDLRSDFSSFSSSDDATSSFTFSERSKRLLGIPDEGISGMVLDTEKYSFMYQYRVLWAKTFISSDDYTPPTKEHPAGLLYGRPINPEFLKLPASEIAPLEGYAIDNPYSIRGQFRSFFGYPFKEEKQTREGVINEEIDIVRAGGFGAKLLPKILTLLNPVKIFTEFVTGLPVAALNTAIHHTKNRYLVSHSTGGKVGWYALLMLERLFLGIFTLVHYAGKSITSPYQNMVDTWKYFEDLRERKEWYWQALGWTLGLLGGLFSMAVTGAMYFLLAPVLTALATLLAGFLGLAGIVYAAGTLAAAVLGPVVSFLAPILAPILMPAMSAVGGLLLGLAMPYIGAVATALDNAASWLANKIVSGVKFLYHKIKNRNQSEETSLEKEPDIEPGDQSDKKSNDKDDGEQLLIDPGLKKSGTPNVQKPNDASDDSIQPKNESKEEEEINEASTNTNTGTQNENSEAQSKLLCTTAQILSTTGVTENQTMETTESQKIFGIIVPNPEEEAALSEYLNTGKDVDDKWKKLFINMLETNYKEYISPERRMDAHFLQYFIDHQSSPDVDKARLEQRLWLAQKFFNCKVANIPLDTLFSKATPKESAKTLESDSDHTQNLGTYIPPNPFTKN